MPELALSELSLVELGWIVEGLIIEAEHTTFLQAGVGGVKPGHGGFVSFGQGWKLAEGLVEVHDVAAIVGMSAQAEGMSQFVQGDFLHFVGGKRFA